VSICIFINDFPAQEPEVVQPAALSSEQEEKKDKPENAPGNEPTDQETSHTNQSMGTLKDNDLEPSSDKGVYSYFHELNSSY
jgi:hypothetical protein